MLDGKTALVTGGSSGIGKAVCARFARAGADVAVVAGSSLQKAASAVAEVSEQGSGVVKGYAADVTSRSAVADLFEQVTKDFGSVDILVTSAGVFHPNPVGDSDPAVFERTINLNVKGTFYCVEAAVPLMKRAGGGKIICLSSGADRIGVAGFSAYCASKAAVTMMVRTLALELAPFDININAIAPGNTATPMNEGMRTDPAQSKILETLAAAVPSRVKFSDPEDVAEVALFLASGRTRAMHGSSILIDEGLTAGISF